MTNHNKQKEQNERIRLSSFSDLLISSLKWWWKNLNMILLLYWQAVLSLIIPFILAIILITLNYFVFKWAVLYGSIMLALQLFIFYFFLRVNISIFLLIKRSFIDKEKNLSIKDLFADSKTLLIPYFILNIFLSLILVLCFLIPAIPAIIVAYTTSPFPILPLALIGLLTIIPIAAITIASIIFSLSNYIFIAEDKRGWSAIKESYYLVRKNFWAFFARLILLILLILLIQAVINIPFEIFGGFSSSSINPSNGIYMGLLLLIAPIPNAFLFKIYQELKNK